MPGLSGSEGLGGCPMLCDSWLSTSSSRLTGVQVLPGDEGVPLSRAGNNVRSPSPADLVGLAGRSTWQASGVMGGFAHGLVLV